MLTQDSIVQSICGQVRPTVSLRKLTEVQAALSKARNKERLVVQASVDTTPSASFLQTLANRAGYKALSKTHGDIVIMCRAGHRMTIPYTSSTFNAPIICTHCIDHRSVVQAIPRVAKKATLQAYYKANGLILPENYLTSAIKYTWTCSAKGHTFEDTGKRIAVKINNGSRNVCHYCEIEKIQVESNVTAVDPLSPDFSYNTAMKWLCNACKCTFVRSPRVNPVCLVCQPR